MAAERGEGALFLPKNEFEITFYFENEFYPIHVLLLCRRPAVGDGLAGGGGVRKLRKSQLEEWEGGRKAGWEEKVGGGRKSKQQGWEGDEKKSGRLASTSLESTLCRQVQSTFWPPLSEAPKASF